MLRGAETERELEMPDRESATSTNRVLDIIFSGILAVMVLVFAIQAAGYRAESARAPFVAMVPLGILVVLKLVRMSRASSISRIKSQTIEQVGEGHTQLKKLMLFILWLVLCVAAILRGAGHICLLTPANQPARVYSSAERWIAGRESRREKGYGVRGGTGVEE